MRGKIVAVSSICAALAVGVAGGAGKQVADSKVAAALPAPTVKLEITLQSVNNPNSMGHGTCSGVYLGHGYILTARHCTTFAAEDAKIVSVNVVLDQGDMAGPRIPAHVVWASDSADIGAFKIDGNIDARSANLACRAPIVGERIEVVGNPLSQDFIHTWGRVAGVSRTITDDNGSQLNYQTPIDAIIASGNSGGPVYDSSGNVLGIANMVFTGGPDAVGHVDYMVSSEAACGMYGPDEIATAK